MSANGLPVQGTARSWRIRAGWVLLGLVLLAAAAWAGWQVSRGPEVVALTVQRRDVVQTVVASGRVETPHRADVGVQVAGRVLRVMAAEGDAVAAGAPLIELAADELQAALKQAELAVVQAQAKLRQLREVQAPLAEQALRQAQANHAAARAARDRQRDLLARGFIGQAALDEAERAEQVAASQVRAAQQSLDSARPAGADVAAAEAALAQAQAGAELARARLAYTRVAAPVAGTVLSRDVEPGDTVQPGKVLMVVSPQGEVQLVLQIDEKNLRLLQPGQPALASADAYPQQRFAAELVLINPAVDAQRGSVQVKLRVPSPPPALRQDMTVSVDIEVARRPQAVLVPAEALHEADGAAPWVLRVEDGHARRRPVRLGLRSGGLAEVLEGLAPGDLVLPVVAGQKLADGARVRVAPPADAPQAGRGAAAPAATATVATGSTAGSAAISAAASAAPAAR